MIVSVFKLSFKTIPFEIEIWKYYELKALLISRFNFLKVFVKININLKYMALRQASQLTFIALSSLLPRTFPGSKIGQQNQIIR